MKRIITIVINVIGITIILLINREMMAAMWDLMDGTLTIAEYNKAIGASDWIILGICLVLLTVNIFALLYAFEERKKSKSTV